MQGNKVAGLALILLTSAFLNGCEDSNVLAKVGDKEITKSDFEAYLTYKRIPQNDIAIQEKVLDDLVYKESLAQEIAKENTINEQAILAEIADLKRQLYINRYFDKFLAERVSDDMIRAYYANNITLYETKQARVAHILIRTNNRMSEQERQAKLTLARQIHSQLTSGENFQAIAKSISEDTVSANKGGDLGWLSEGAVSPEFSSRAFKLKQGEITEPFSTVFGFHIVTLLEEPQTARKPLEAVEGSIRYQLRSEAKSAEIERLKQDVKVTRQAIKE
ncbi:peptidylprolyl isomerase [Agarivorans albus]|uniref:peptidylprolyl isomerase n=1 Tax=Agarivorans albus MKT 106 TaxID=1331007 RepID=R9PR42_AGAAL|nr:peptidylprolyl isomerase [Agarivorans albus]GAD03837.1 peptidyl-prolyl cis-trans isomerase PpiD [Agarivorans albus MKT 106]